MYKSILLSSLVSSFLFASSEIKDVKDNTIIIYNNLALISNKASVDIEKGKSVIQFPNVSTNLITDSVSINFKNKDINILEQNYKYDLVNFNSILNYYIDKKVKYKDNIVTLLSNGNSCVIQENGLNDNSIKLVGCNELVVDKLPEGMTTKPSLYWDIYSNMNNKSNDIELSYLSNGFGWTSNYVATLNEDSISFNGWVKLTNTSDVDFIDYKLVLLSGNVNQISKQENQRGHMEKSFALMSSNMDVEVKEESFAGYHTYKIPFNVDIPHNSNKQISFINKNISIYNTVLKTNINVYNNNDRIKFSKYIVFNNSKESGLGIPLPSGKIRFYKKDLEGINYFLGESFIENTPLKENLSLKIGEDFDTTLKFKVLERINKDSKQYYKFEYYISNPSKEIKKFEIAHNNPINHIKTNNIEIDTDCKYNCKMILENVNEIKYLITLEPETNYKFVSKFEK